MSMSRYERAQRFISRVPPVSRSEALDVAQSFEAAKEEFFSKFRKAVVDISPEAGSNFEEMEGFAFSVVDELMKIANGRAA